MIDLASVKVLFSEELGSIAHYSYSRDQRVLTVLRATSGCVEARRFKVMTLVESMQDYATNFKLMRAIKLVLG